MKETTETKEMTDRELDARIAVKLMGGKWVRYWDADYKDPDSYDNKVHAFLLVDPDDLNYYLTNSRYNRNGADYVEDNGECQRDGFASCPRYSTDIAAAFQVVERMTALGRKWSMTNNSGAWELECGRYAVDESLPRAICLAALEAIKEKED